MEEFDLEYIKDLSNRAMKYTMHDRFPPVENTYAS